MASYKRNANDNRESLFGPNPGSSSAAPKKPASRTKPSASIGATSTTTTASAASTPQTNKTDTRRIKNGVRTLTGQANIDKMKEAEEYRKKAKKALQRTLFDSPDPIAGAMFYHRAAEAYKLCGENRLERLHRIASGDCQMGHDAYATAASEYMRAAELSEMSDEAAERKRAECTKLYADAAKAWREENEMGRAGECMLRSGFSLLIGRGDDNDIILGGQRLAKMNKDAMVVIEAAVENHVPDPLNRYRKFRQTGISSFADPDAEGENGGPSEPDEATLELCRHHMVKTSFAHETVNQAIQKFVEYGEYRSALYAAGAVSALLESDGFSTISLSRVYCVETVLTLALGDVVAADKYFLAVHLQNNNYLSSRECKLAEDLIRAIKMRNVDDLEIARDPNGENRAALSNLDPKVRNAVATLRISGAAKSQTMKPTRADPVTASANPATATPLGAAPPSSMGGQKLENELDDLMNNMGLDSDEEDEDHLDLR